MSKEHRGLAEREQGDMRRLFPLLKDLFEFVEKQGFDAESFRNYLGETQSKDCRPVALPQRFQALVSEFPASYFIVAYENRRNPYYAQGTNHRLVRLSTVERKAISNKKIREIDIAEMDPSHGNFVEMTVTESINNKEFADINQAGDDDIESPHGSARFVYHIDSEGKKQAQRLTFNRLDEGLFQFGAAIKVVRWVRDLEITLQPAKLTYKDFYLLGRSRDIRGEERAEIKTEISGSLEHPESIVIQIGIGAPSSARVLYADPASKIRVLVHSGMNAYARQLEILKEDPVYKTPFENPVDTDGFVQALTGRVAMLRDDWDKPQTVYQNTPHLDAPK